MPGVPEKLALSIGCNPCKGNPGCVVQSLDLFQREGSLSNIACGALHHHRADEQNDLRSQVRPVQIHLHSGQDWGSRFNIGAPPMNPEEIHRSVDGPGNRALSFKHIHRSFVAGHSFVKAPHAAQGVGPERR